MGAVEKERKAAQLDLLTVRAVAKRLGLTEGHIYAMVARREIPCVKFSKAVRFEPEAVDEFIRDHRRKAGKADLGRTDRRRIAGAGKEE